MRHPRQLRAAAPAWSLAAFILCAAHVAAVAQQPPQARAKSLAELRADYAMRFLEPDAHMALAKYFRDAGNRLQAFYTLESARRGRFEREEFDEAFSKAFREGTPHDHSPAAEAALLARLAARADDLEAVDELIDIYAFRKDWKKAREFITKAVALRPDDFKYTFLMARLLNEVGDEAGAERVLREYAAKHPGNVESYRVKISDAMEKESPEAKTLLAEAVQKFPQEGAFAFDLGTVLQKEKKLDEAEELFVRAARLSPESAHIQAWVGRFFYKVREDNRRALDYYLSAYLLDPHAYETEHVESRIPKINEALARVEYERRVKAGEPLEKLLEDPNPAVIYHALDAMSERWQPAYLKALIGALGHDDGGARWAALTLLAEKVDRSFDPTLKALLADPDPRRRGLAAYLAARLWRRESFPALRAMLREESQLLRFDAISALAMEGGAEGRQLISEHLKAEPHPRLRRLIELALKPESEQP